MRLRFIGFFSRLLLVTFGPVADLNAKQRREIPAEAAKAPPAATLSGDLSALFGIEISDGTEVAQVKPAKKPNKKKPQNTKGKVAQVVGRGAKPKKANKQPVKSKTAKKDSVLKSSGVKAGAKAGVVKASGKSTRTNDKTPSEKSKPTKKVRSGGKRIGR